MVSQLKVVLLLFLSCETTFASVSTVVAPSQIAEFPEVIHVNTGAAGAPLVAPRGIISLNGQSSDTTNTTGATNTTDATNTDTSESEDTSAGSFGLPTYIIGVNLGFYLVIGCLRLIAASGFMKTLTAEENAKAVQMGTCCCIHMSEAKDKQTTGKPSTASGHGQSHQSARQARSYTKSGSAKYEAQCPGMEADEDISFDVELVSKKLRACVRYPDFVTSLGRHEFCRNKEDNIESRVDGREPGASVFRSSRLWVVYFGVAFVAMLAIATITFPRTQGFGSVLLIIASSFLIVGQICRVIRDWLDVNLSDQSSRAQASILFYRVSGIPLAMFDILVVIWMLVRICQDTMGNGANRSNDMAIYSLFMLGFQVNIGVLSNNVAEKATNIASITIMLCMILITAVLIPFVTSLRILNWKNGKYASNTGASSGITEYEASNLHMITAYVTLFVGGAEVGFALIEHMREGLKSSAEKRERYATALIQFKNALAGHNYKIDSCGTMFDYQNRLKELSGEIEKKIIASEEVKEDLKSKPDDAGLKDQSEQLDKEIEKKRKELANVLEENEASSPRQHAAFLKSLSAVNDLAATLTSEDACSFVRSFYKVPHSESDFTAIEVSMAIGTGLFHQEDDEGCEDIFVIEPNEEICPEQLGILYEDDAFVDDGLAQPPVLMSLVKNQPPVKKEAVDAPVKKRSGRKVSEWESKLEAKKTTCRENRKEGKNEATLEKFRLLLHGSEAIGLAKARARVCYVLGHEKGILPRLKSYVQNMAAEPDDSLKVGSSKYLFTALVAGEYFNALMDVQELAIAVNKHSGNQNQDAVKCLTIFFVLMVIAFVLLVVVMFMASPGSSSGNWTNNIVKGNHERLKEAVKIATEKALAAARGAAVVEGGIYEKFAAAFAPHVTIS